MTDETLPKIEIPVHHQEFCKAIARVAREHGMENFSGSYRPKFRDAWHDQINFSWEQGRHGEDSDRLHITSSMHVHTTLGPPKPRY